MARERTADDQVLALLARTVLPLEMAEIARALGWSKQMVSAVLQRLAPHLEITAGTKTGESGRPSQKYTLRSAVRPPAGMPPPVHFEPFTYVIPPSGREARVLLHRCDGYVEIEYLDERPPLNRAVVKAHLLRAFKPGREAPPPYREPE